MTTRDSGKCSRCNLLSPLGFNIIFQMLQCDYFHILFSTAENLWKCILKAQDLNHVTDITTLFIHYITLHYITLHYITFFVHWSSVLPFDI